MKEEAQAAAATTTNGRENSTVIVIYTKEKYQGFLGEFHEALSSSLFLSHHSLNESKYSKIECFVAYQLFFL